MADFGIESLGLSGQWAHRAAARGHPRRLRPPPLRRGRGAPLPGPRPGVASWPRPTTCSSRSTGWPRACPPRSTSTRWPTSTVERLRSLIDCDVTALLLRDDVTGRWIVAAGEGAVAARPAGRRDPARRPCGPPPPAAWRRWWSAWPRARASARRSCPGPASTPPCGPGARWSGLVALEHHEAGRYGRRELQLLDGFIDSAALAIDNARWFGRLRGMGADEERTRIARDMHDRIGQSLAYVAFELDRLTGQAEEPFKSSLDGLRTEVRGVLGEVRDTLSDLRAEVSDQRGLVDTLEAFLERVAARTDVDGRLPPREHRPPAPRPGAGAVAHRPGGDHQRRAPRPGHPPPGPLGAATAARPSSRWPTTAGASRSTRPGRHRLLRPHRACRSGPTPSAPPSLVESEPYVGTLVECRVDAPAVQDQARHGQPGVPPTQHSPPPLRRRSRKLPHDPTTARRRPPDAPRGPAPLAGGPRLRGGGRGRRRPGGLPPGPRADARRGPDGRHHARPRRRGGHPPDPRLGARHRRW